VPNEERPTMRVAGAISSWLNDRPILGPMLTGLLFAAAGGAAAIFVMHMVQTRPVDALVVAVPGTVVGLSGAAVWLYAFAKGFDVSLAVGRASFLLTLAMLFAAAGAVMSTGLLQVLCASVVAGRLLPQVVFTILQAREDGLHPATRTERVARAMTIAWPSEHAVAKGERSVRE